MINSMSDVQSLFQASQRDAYDFSHGPELVTSRRGAAESLGLDASTASRWERIQAGFLQRAKRKEKYNREMLERMRQRYGAVIERLGGLTGNVLDIGGGWGLYRQWWRPADGGMFIVHDPGVDRILSGPHETHLSCFERAFTLPMTFVEGVGEHLPYCDGTFDACIIAAALDHCASPPGVISEAHRCLKSGGRLLLFQDCSERKVKEAVRFGRRAARYATRPGLLVRKLLERWSAPPGHMHHFTMDGLASLMRDCGFSTVDVQSVDEPVFLFVGTKGELPAEP